MDKLLGSVESYIRSGVDAFNTMSSNIDKLTKKVGADKAMKGLKDASDTVSGLLEKGLDQIKKYLGG